MVEKKPRIVIIGAGMAGLTAANKIFTSSKDVFEISVVEGGTRIGGRIKTSEFMGDRIEMGATWIHGVSGSPVHKIAQEIGALDSDHPWECMDAVAGEPTTVAEGGFELSRAAVDPISGLFKKLMDYAQKTTEIHCAFQGAGYGGNGGERLSVGAYLREGLDLYWSSRNGEVEENGCGEEWSKKSVEEGVFAMHENIQRTFTSAGELSALDFRAESEYQMFPGEEITIAKGYSSIVESIASVLPSGLVQLGKKVTRIEWRPEGEIRHGFRPVKLHFSDGSAVSADHVIVTVSLGVLKEGTRGDLFSPPLPAFKTAAISRLGYGVVNKLFLAPAGAGEFPFLNFVFHRPDSELRRKKIPWWMRRTASLHPIYKNSPVLLSWFAGDEALELEKLADEEIIAGVSTTISNFLPRKENGFKRVVKSEWGTDPLFLGSYSYVAVGSGGEDLDAMAEPLPSLREGLKGHSLQLLFAGEATHRTHYSTTHGAYLSGVREANRLLRHYNCV